MSETKGRATDADHSRLFDAESIRRVRERAQRWCKNYERMPRREEVDFTTTSGESTPVLTTPADVESLDYEADLGFPGEYPFTRGVHATMYRGRLWTMRQFSGFGTAADTNRRYKFLLAHGQTGLSVAFDMPTIMGRDSDDPLSEGEVGNFECGVDPAINAYYMEMETSRDHTTLIVQKFVQTEIAGEMVYDTSVIPGGTMTTLARDDELVQRVPLLTDELFAGPPPSF
mgnify:CR=1 FL=1